MHHQHPSSGNEPWQDLPEGFAERLEHETHENKPLRDAILDRVALAVHVPPALIIDVGSGTGADTVALAQQFPAAEVYALDVSSELLKRVTSLAETFGVADRVVEYEVDLNRDWFAPFLNRVDLAWASLSLHHLNDPGEALRRVFATLKPGGVFVLTELSMHGGEKPQDWQAHLMQAGFATVERQDELPQPWPPSGSGHAERSVWISRRG